MIGPFCFGSASVSREEIGLTFEFVRLRDSASGLRSREGTDSCDWAVTWTRARCEGSAEIESEWRAPHLELEAEWESRVERTAAPDSPVHAPAREEREEKKEKKTEKEGKKNGNKRKTEGKEKKKTEEKKREK